MKIISVVITTHNGAFRGFLEDTIHSVLKQTYPHFELIIVDDGSEDTTKELCKKFLKDSRVRYTYQENRGPAAARNTGIKLSKYDYISFLDDDDLYLPAFLETMLSVYNQKLQEKPGIIYCGTDWIDKKSAFLKTHFIKNEKNCYEKLLYGNFITTSAVLIHKSVFKKVGLFKEHLRYVEDYDMWLRICRHFPSYALEKSLVNYRVHDNQLSSRFEKMQAYHNIVLFDAIKEAPEAILKKEKEILHAFHITYASINLGYQNLSSFKVNYLKAKSYHKMPLKWHLKFFLSFFPRLFFLIQKMAKQTKLLKPIYRNLKSSF